MINLQNVSLIRDQKEILKDIDWRVKPGEHWALMGLNGSGKSTLLNIISGQLWPTTGSVEVLGERFGQTKLPQLKKRIGWVSSALNTKLNQYDTVERIILSGLFHSIGIYQKYGEEELGHVDAVMERLNILALKGRKFHTCSQGEQQMVLIARSLISDPELLILDEPCNGLDLFASEKLLQQIEQLTREENAPTILYVTHHIHEITPMFSHILLLKSGRSFQQGRIEDILTTDHLSAFYDHDVEVIQTKQQRYHVYVC